MAAVKRGGGAVPGLGTRVRRVPRPPQWPRDAHKGTRGTVLVVAGSRGMLGAAILVATAALRSGAGLVRVALPKELQPLLPLAQPCATTVGRAVRELRAAAGAARAVVVGPGLGLDRAAQRCVAEVLRSARGPVVLDADALHLLGVLAAADAPATGLQRALRAAAERVGVVLTPHPGEAGRLLGTPAAAVQAGRQAALRELVQRTGACVVLKGAGSLVGAAGQWFVNRTGSPALGTGGSGDVLAGALGALLAQGMPPFAAACCAVHAHGRAGEVLARRWPRGVLASDLPAAIAEVLQ
ncbi:MAG: NAD(P)H-hydrate dehydratase [Planctomycetes bacterium]|nr:NAD(P)H-hydrate dehydratase [Planctomycetota bacterium]